VKAPLLQSRKKQRKQNAYNFRINSITEKFEQCRNILSFFLVNPKWHIAPFIEKKNLVHLPALTVVQNPFLNPYNHHRISFYMGWFVELLISLRKVT
jgi:hypothetical protein